MDTNNLCDIIERLLREHTRIPYAHGEIDIQTVFDCEQDRYLVMLAGWERPWLSDSC